MKNIGITLMALLLALFTWQCEQSVKGTVLEGQIDNAANMQVYLDQVKIGKASNVLSKAEIDANGQFSMEFPEGIEPGVYQMRIGAKNFNLVFDGSEKKVELQGDLNDIHSEICMHMAQALMPAGV